MMIKTFEQAYKYLCTKTDYERMTRFSYSRTTFNLDRMRQLIGQLGNPHNFLKCIHIAGTKGKGSTAIIISNILVTAGYRVGLFTSPHLMDIRERIQINNQPIRKSDFACLMEQIRRASSSIKGLTFFEIITAMALLYFRGQSVDWAVMEVGLGGRLDATNIITPYAGIITRLDFDHMDKLGNTIAAIAREKAGIIKPGIPVITLKQSFPDASRVIKTVAHQRQAPIHIARPVFGYSLLGKHQAENVGLAVTALKLLARAGYIKLSQSVITRALRNISLPGRIEVVQHSPLLIIDSAHNPVAIQALRDTLRTLNYHKLILVMGASRDKDISGMIDIILPVSDVVIFTHTDNPRLMEPMGFVAYLKEHHLERPIFLEPDYRRAFGLARRLATKRDLILVTGSFYLAGEILKLIR